MREREREKYLLFLTNLSQLEYVLLSVYHPKMPIHPHTDVSGMKPAILQILFCFFRVPGVPQGEGEIMTNVT